MNRLVSKGNRADSGDRQHDAVDAGHLRVSARLATPSRTQHRVERLEQHIPPSAVDIEEERWVAAKVDLSGCRFDDDRTRAGWPESQRS